jgi:hypothetical protein
MTLDHLTQINDTIFFVSLIVNFLPQRTQRTQRGREEERIRCFSVENYVLLEFQ